MDIPPGAPGGGPVLAPLVLVDEVAEIHRPSGFTRFNAKALLLTSEISQFSLRISMFHERD
jgi:hypothetical protein